MACFLPLRFFRALDHQIINRNTFFHHFNRDIFILVICVSIISFTLFLFTFPPFTFLFRSLLQLKNILPTLCLA